MTFLTGLPAVTYHAGIVATGTRGLCRHIQDPGVVGRARIRLAKAHPENQSHGCAVGCVDLMRLDIQSFDRWNGTPVEGRFHYRAHDCLPGPVETEFARASLQPAGD